MPDYSLASSVAGEPMQQRLLICSRDRCVITEGLSRVAGEDRRVPADAYQGSQAAELPRVHQDERTAEPCLRADSENREGLAARINAIERARQTKQRPQRATINQFEMVRCGCRESR